MRVVPTVMIDPSPRSACSVRTSSTRVPLVEPRSTTLGVGRSRTIAWRRETPGSVIWTSASVPRPMMLDVLGERDLLPRDVQPGSREVRVRLHLAWLSLTEDAE